MYLKTMFSVYYISEPPGTIYLVLQRKKKIGVKIFFICKHRRYLILQLKIKLRIIVSEK